MGDAADDLREVEEELWLAHKSGDCDTLDPCPICHHESEQKERVKRLLCDQDFDDYSLPAPGDDVAWIYNEDHHQWLLVNMSLRSEDGGFLTYCFIDAAVLAHQDKQFAARVMSEVLAGFNDAVAAAALRARWIRPSVLTAKD